MDKLKLTGLWKNTDKNGQTFLTGSINPAASVMIMPNSYKKAGDTKSPDYFLYLVPKEKDENQRAAPSSDL